MNNSKFKVGFMLKQHTPIIHFQSEQSGATLRASELKPKFDRFLKKYAFNGEIPKEFKIKDDTDAIDFKVSIKTSSNKKNISSYKTYISKRDRGTPNLYVGSYFGDTKAISIKQDNFIEITFLSISQHSNEIIKIIKQYFVDFINITNFGTRQNKGFGSFEVISIDNEHIENNIEKSLLKYYPVIYTAKSNDPLKRILTDYQLLKSGTSTPQYRKSLLFEYMCDSKIRWEKRMIKEYMEKNYPEVFSNLKFEKQPVRCNNEQNFDYQYIRGLLGIAEQIEFLKSNSKNPREKIKIQIKATNNDIERFKSPITFKVIDNNIYILASNDIKIKGKMFEFSIKGEKGILNKAIEVPTTFNIFKFLNFALPKLKYNVLKASK